MGPQSVPYDVGHRFLLDRGATAEFLIKFAIETERHLLDVRPDAFTLCHTAGPFGVSRVRKAAPTANHRLGSREKSHRAISRYHDI